MADFGVDVQVGVPAELHIYAKVGHGFGLTPKLKPPASEWPEQFEQWVNNMGFVKKEQ